MNVRVAEYRLPNMTILYNYLDTEWLYMVFRPIKYQPIYKIDANYGIGI
jgi:hypothetical protein